MRTGIIVYGLDRPLTGISRYTLELVLALAQQEPLPDVLLLLAGEAAPIEKLPFPAIRLPLSRRLPGLLTVGQWVLRRIAQQQKLTAIHDPTGVTPLSLLPTNVKRIVTLHDVFALSIPGYSSRLDTLIYRYWLPHMASRLARVITPSMHSKQEIEERLGISAEIISVIPQGVSPIYQQHHSADVQTALQQRFQLTDPYIFFVGNLTERKNLRRALEAFAQIAPAFPALNFALAGPRSWKQTPIEALVKKWQIEERVQLLGSVTDADLVQLYNGASLLLFPSLYEGFGLPVVEAMACGTPVITSNISSLPDVAGDAALLVDPTDVQAIAAALTRVLSSAELSQQLSERGLAHAAQFSWQATAAATVGVYGS